MGLGFSMKIAPGVRVRASSRGLSAGIGPRAARVHVGTRGVGVSSGAGPLSAYGHLGGGRSTRPRNSRTAYERQLRQQARLEQIESAQALVHAFQQTYLRVHQQEFTVASAPQAPPVEPVDERAIRKAERRAGREGIRLWQRALRRAARAQADGIAQGKIAELADTRRRQREQQQAEFDEAWRALLANEPKAVLTALEAAFADNDAPAAAVGCEGRSVSVVVRMPDRDEIVPEVHPDLTPTGRPTVKKMTKTSRNHLHLGAVLSHALVTAKEAFAVAPNVDTVLLLALMDASGGLRPVYAGEYSRAAFDGVNWSDDNPAEIAGRFVGLSNMKGRTDELGCLELGDEPALLNVAERIAADLDLPLDPLARRTQRS